MIWTTASSLPFGLRTGGNAAVLNVLQKMVPFADVPELMRTLKSMPPRL